MGAGSRGRVLVVDDEEDMREMMSLVLRVEGYDVVAVPDGASALRAVRAARFEAATLDLRMPGMDGIETLKELRRLFPDAAVVVVSGYVTPAEADACLALGAFAIVHKPFSVEELVDAIARAQERETRDTPHAS
jgi:CheY-like chemotaxis protein